MSTTKYGTKPIKATPIKKVAGGYQPAHLLEVAQQAIDAAAQGGIQ